MCPAQARSLHFIVIWTDCSGLMTFGVMAVMVLRIDAEWPGWETVYFR